MALVDVIKSIRVLVGLHSLSCSLTVPSWFSSRTIGRDTSDWRVCCITVVPFGFPFPKGPPLLLGFVGTPGSGGFAGHPLFGNGSLRFKEGTLSIA